MSQFLWSTMGTMYGNRLATFDDERSDLWVSRFAYSYYQHTPAATGVDPYFSAWSRSGISVADQSIASMFGADPSVASGRWDDTVIWDSGYIRYWFVRGVCKDGSNNLLGGAKVELFLTASDLWVSTVATDGSGNYQAPTPYNGQNHYAVANYGPNTLVGATVNTLVPAL
jgi:hypothetical protein